MPEFVVNSFFDSLSEIRYLYTAQKIPYISLLIRDVLIQKIFQIPAVASLIYLDRVNIR
jgi:hypothetical protein